MAQAPPAPADKLIRCSLETPRERVKTPGACVTAIWRKSRRFIVHRVLHADDTPHRIALGVAAGLFIGLTPTVGFQMVLAVALAAALRANKVVCIPMVWITNPFTIIPIYISGRIPLLS